MNDVAYLPLSRGLVAVIDAADLPLVGRHKWTAFRAGRNRFRACRREAGPDGRRICVHLHRQLLNAPDGVEVDHIDGDPLNNRRANLRLCDRQQNAANRAPWCKSGFKGVIPHRRRWVAKIGVRGRQIYLGCFATAVEAAKAYDAAAREHFGDFAFVNFRDAQA